MIENISKRESRRIVRATLKRIRQELNRCDAFTLSHHPQFARTAEKLTLTVTFPIDEQLAQEHELFQRTCLIGECDCERAVSSVRA